jgi:hypothetical protein
MLPFDLEEIIINLLINSCLKSNDLRYYKFGRVCRSWKYTIDNHIFNPSPQYAIYTNKLKYNEYNKDIISICKSGCLGNVKWLLKNNIIFSDIHVVLMCNRRKIDELEEIFSDPIQLYNIHTNKSLHRDIRTIYLQEIEGLSGNAWHIDSIYTSIPKFTGPLQIASIIGSIRLAKLLLANGYKGLIPAIHTSIKYRHLHLTTYLLINHFKEIAYNYESSDITDLINIINMLIIEFGSQAQNLIYYIINSSLKINSVILKIIYNYSGRSGCSGIYLYTINRIISTNDRKYIKKIFNAYGLQQIIYNLIYDRNHTLCNIIISKLIEYDHEYIIPIYEVFNILHNYYTINDGDKICNNIILKPKQRFSYSIVNILYNYVKLVLNTSHVFKYKMYTTTSDLVMILVYFIGTFQCIENRNEWYIDNRYHNHDHNHHNSEIINTYGADEENIKDDCDYNDILNMNLLGYIMKLKDMKYRINFKGCIKTCIHFDNKDILMYFVDAM